MVELKYKRVLLKISGEAFGDDENKLFDFVKIKNIAELVSEIQKTGAEVAIVNGAGNIFRGAVADQIDRTDADFIGMTATMVNSLALQAVLRKLKVPESIYSVLPIGNLIPELDISSAKADLESGKAVILTGGDGKPYFTNDTAGVKRAVELECELIIKASTVDGVYSDDPKLNPDALKFDQISYEDVLNKGLKVMDQAAIEIARDNNLKIIVTKFEKESVLKILQGENIGTLIG